MILPDQPGQTKTEIEPHIIIGKSQIITDQGRKIMTKIEQMALKADELQRSGMTTGQIADELNISAETVMWLITNKKPQEGSIIPKDISVNWSSLGQNATRLRCTAQTLCDMVLEEAEKQGKFIDLVVGVSSSGVPVAGFMANELESGFSMYYSKKENMEGRGSSSKGTFSRNFGNVRGKTCVIVDDVITTGGTLSDAVTSLKLAGADPVAIAVLVDKVNYEEIEGVPVVSMVKITRLG